MHVAIDIGTNTVLLLVAEIDSGSIKTLHEEQRIPRLGKGVDSSGNLDVNSMSRVIDALKDYKQLLDSRFDEVNDISVTATSAVRDANNGMEFIKEIRKETGFDVMVLSGLDEAKYTYMGAVSMLPELSNATVIDIGGGSTEIAIGEKKTLLDSHSFDMGSVRFTERFFSRNPPTENEINNCREAIKKLLKERSFNIDGSINEFTLIGVAGTVTSLAYMDLGLANYDSEQIKGYQITRQNLRNWIAAVSDSTSEKLVEKYPEVMRGRAEVILAGLLILSEFMNFYEIPNLTVSTGGIRHGTILNKAAMSN